MALKDPFAQEVVEKLGVLGVISGKAMFGGWGFYCEGVFFAGIMEERRVFLKADGETEALFREAGAKQWIWDGDPSRGPVAMKYWSPEGDWLDDPAEVMKWGTLGLEAGQRSALKRKPKKPRAKRT